MTDIKERKYTFNKAISPDNVEMISKTADELTKSERFLLLGTLIDTWNNTPIAEQQNFLNHVTKTFLG